MPYSLIVDLLVAVLLVVTIGYAIVLNRRLGRLRRDKAELKKLASTFTESTARAEESIETLKHAADLLQERIEKGVALRDDLAFLIDRGGQAADSLEDLVRETRDRMGVGARPGVKAGAAPQLRPAPLVMAADTDDAPGDLDRGDPASGNSAPGNSASGNSASGNSAPGNSASGNSALGDAGKDGDEPRSEAERELLKAIRSAG